MGKKDIITKNYIRRPEIFADIFNYRLYGGKDRIQPYRRESGDKSKRKWRKIWKSGNRGKIQRYKENISGRMLSLSDTWCRRTG